MSEKFSTHANPQAEKEAVVLKKLKEVFPAAWNAFGKLQDPSLSREQFLALIDEINEADAEGAPAVGDYEQVTTEISKGRSVSVKLYKNGRVVLDGSFEAI